MNERVVLFLFIPDDKKACLVKSVTSLYLAKSLVAICMQNHRAGNSVYIQHCATAFSMQSCAESAYQPYADGYH